MYISTTQDDFGSCSAHVSGHETAAVFLLQARGYPLKVVADTQGHAVLKADLLQASVLKLPWFRLVAFRLNSCSRFSGHEVSISVGRSFGTAYCSCENNQAQERHLPLSLMLHREGTQE
jgi:hypothetical protein